MAVTQFELELLNYEGSLKMIIARIKFSGQAIPREYEFATKKEAEDFCAEKTAHNPYVRWTEIDTKRDYPNN